MMIIQANEQECNMLLEILHRALLHSGIQVADAVMIWRHKIMSAAKEVQPKDVGNGVDRITAN